MYRRLLSLIVQCLSKNPTVAPAAYDLAQQLMEGAEARAGRHPRQAEELRFAARAYLSVIR